jgi:GTP-binding protein
VPALNVPIPGHGNKLTFNVIQDRLLKEAEGNVSIKVEDADEDNFVKVSGRGELQLGILIENMRREGFEMSISRPKVVYKEVDGKRHEPIEEVTIDVPADFANTVIRLLTLRKGQLLSMDEIGGGQSRLTFDVPTRGLIGFRSELLTETRGNGIMNSIFREYREYEGAIENLRNGVLISNDEGASSAYAINDLQDRGVFLIGGGETVYEGMIVGIHSKQNSLDVNVTKEKKLSNMRASGKDDAIKLIPKKEMTLEECMSFIQSDELIEVTPKIIRLRKKFLKPNERKRASSQD